MSKPEMTNLHILGYFNERLSDVAKLDQFIKTQRSDETEPTSKRKIALISTKKRTSSYMRYKLPKIKKQRIVKENAAQNGKKLKSRQQKRNRNLLSKLHSIHELEVTDRSSKATEKTTARWLETHYWHKKRFSTKLQWGYCLPLHHRGRGKKFLHSAVQESTVIHDRSYIRPLEIIGIQEDVQQLLDHFTVSLASFCRKIHFFVIQIHFFLLLDFTDVKDEVFFTLLMIRSCIFSTFIFKSLYESFLTC
jgi:hypothetical protein